MAENCETFLYIQNKVYFLQKSANPTLLRLLRGLSFDLNGRREKEIILLVISWSCFTSLSLEELPTVYKIEKSC